MNLPEVLSPLAEPLEDTCELIRRSGRPGMIIGAVCLGLVARPRQTNDVDATLWCPDDAHFGSIFKLATDIGLEPRRPDAVAFAQRVRVLQLRHGRTRIGVDLSLALLPFEEQAIAARLIAKAEELTIPHATPEDLAVMKLVAHRDQDLIDLHNVVRHARTLDRRKVLHWSRDFARLLDSPDLVDEIQSTLTKYRPSRKPR